MTKVHQRLISILEEFLEEKSMLNRAFLASRLHVSTKTIQKDIKLLNDILEGHGAKIESQRGTGYELEIIQTKKFEDFCMSLFQKQTGQIPTSYEERVTYILQRLLTTDGYVKLSQLAEEIYVSKSTVNLIMKDVTDIYSRYKLQIEKRPYYGIRIVGEEFNIRSCLSQYGLLRYEHTPFHEQFEQTAIYVSLPHISLIRSIILKYIEGGTIYISDIEIDNVVIHVAIVLKRCQEQHYISGLNMDNSELIIKKEYAIAQQILRDLEKELKLSFPEEEVLYVTMHLLSTAVTVRDHYENVEELIGKDIHALMQHILFKVAEERNLIFYYDEELLFGFGVHLKTLLNRLKYKLNMRNPLLEEVKKNYPYAFEIAVLVGDIISEYTGEPIPESEIGYIAIHFGGAMSRLQEKNKKKRCLVVCATGQGSAQLLKYKILSQFRDKLEIVGITGYYQLKVEDLYRDKIDCIISTIHIPSGLPVPVIKVNFIFDDKEIKSIGQQLFMHVNNSVQQYIKEDLIFLNYSASMKGEVIQFLCEKAAEKNYVPEAFYDSVMERENTSPTAVGNLVAIPHPMQLLSEKTFLMFCTLDKAVDWGDKKVQVIILFSVKRNNNEDLQRLYDFLYDIMSSQNTIEKLTQATEIEKFQEILLSL
ncbi:PTS fructose transporter subunit IIA [Bacillus cereus]|nr:PTS fructose transporter subunit IIA [Bacillus cereus]PGU65120.1 PTS fructose transporter subunit IIA [Bacillus cereus]